MNATGAKGCIVRDFKCKLHSSPLNEARQGVIALCSDWPAVPKVTREQLWSLSVHYLAPLIPALLTDFVGVLDIIKARKPMWKCCS